MEAIKVSVVVPVYNVDEFLDNTLSDITGQTLREIEIICVDDGSTDNSCKIIEEWMEKDSRIQLIRQKNQYAGVARNNGLKQAHGKYVIFWDADDLFEHNALEVMYAQAEQENSDICICEARKYDNAKEKYIPSDAYLKEDLLPGKQTFNKFDVPDYIFNLTNNVPWNKLYLKEFITKNKLQYQAIKQANDTYFTIMALFLAERITYVKDVLIAYRVNNDESLSGKASDTVFCAYDSWLYAKEHIEKYPDFNLVRFSFLNRALSGFYHALNIQTTFESYEKLYRKLVEEGFHEFGLDECTEENIYAVWMYKDMQKMYETEPADFLVQKSITRRVNNENNNVRRKILREKNAVLRENVQALKEDKKTLQSDKKKLQEEKKKLEGEKKKLQKEIDNKVPTFGYDANSDAVAAIAEGYGGTVSQHADVQAYLTLRVLRNALDGVDVDTGIGTADEAGNVLSEDVYKYSEEERSYYALNAAVTADNYKDFTDSTVVWKPVSNQLDSSKHPTKKVWLNIYNASDNFLSSTYQPLLQNYDDLLNLDVEYIGGDGQTESNVTNRLGNPNQYDAFAINMVKTDNAASYTAILNQ